jgi:hypothetical protein
MHLGSRGQVEGLHGVKNGLNAMFVLSPHYPKLRTLVGAAGRSVQCHNRP